MLVDTGMIDSTPELDAEWGVRFDADLIPRDVVCVINTHLHFDHCGGNRLFPGMPIHVQRAEREAAKAPDYRSRSGSSSRARPTSSTTARRRFSRACASCPRRATRPDTSRCSSTPTTGSSSSPATSATRGGSSTAASRGRRCLACDRGASGSPTRPSHATSARDRGAGHPLRAKRRRAIAYQVVGEGETDLVWVPDFVSNLVYGWESPLLARVLRPAGAVVPADPLRQARHRPVRSRRPVPDLRDAHGGRARRPRCRRLVERCPARFARRLLDGALYAATYPERTRALVLFHPAARPCGAEASRVSDLPRLRNMGHTGVLR